MIHNDNEKIMWNLPIYYFSSFLISFKIFSRSFNVNILRLVFAFAAFVGSVVSGSFATSGSGVGSRSGI